MNKNSQISLSEKFWEAHKAKVAEILDVKIEDIEVKPFEQREQDEEADPIPMVRIGFDRSFEPWQLDAIEMIPG